MRIKRQQEIVDFINKHHSVTFSDLCKKFAVSNATMRRDLVTLEHHGLIERVHGGAKTLSIEETTSPIFSQRIVNLVHEKEKIAEYAIQLIKNGDSVFLDASTTCLKLAEVIQTTTLSITVITNYFEIASLFFDSETIDTIFIGGNIRKGYSSTSGNLAEQMLYTMHMDKAFIGTDGIDPYRGLSNNRLDVIAIKKIVISNSNSIYCLADYTKFTTTAVIPFASLQEINSIITNHQLSNEQLASYDELASSIICV